MAKIKTVVELSPDGIRLVKGYQAANGKYIILSALEGKEIHINEYGYLDTQECIDSLTILLAKARESGSNALGDFIYVLPPDTLQIMHATADKTLTLKGKITQLDYENCTNLLNKKIPDDGYTIIYDDPYMFSHDNKSEISDFPLGVKSMSLSVSADVHLIKSEMNSYYSNILKNLGIVPALKLVSPFAGIQYLVGQHAEGSFFSLEVEKTYSYLSLYKSGRMTYAEKIDFGTDNVVAIAGEKLGLSKERTEELLSVFGLRSDAGFSYATEEGLTLNRISKEFIDAYSTLFDRTVSVIRKYDPDHKTYIILTGSGSEVDFLDKVLSYAADRMSVSKLNIRQIGARSTVYVNCLGAMRVAGYDYQKQNGDENSDMWMYSSGGYEFGRN